MVQLASVAPATLFSSGLYSSNEPDFDKELAEHHDWLILLEHIRKSQQVVVGEIEEIEDITAKQKVSNPTYHCQIKGR